MTLSREEVKKLSLKAMARAEEQRRLQDSSLTKAQRLEETLALSKFMSELADAKRRS